MLTKIVYGVAGAIILALIGITVFQQISYNSLENDFIKQKEVVSILESNTKELDSVIASLKANQTFFAERFKIQSDALLTLQNETASNRDSIRNIPAIREVTRIQEVARENKVEAAEILQGGMDAAINEIIDVASSDIDS